MYRLEKPEPKKRKGAADLVANAFAISELIPLSWLKITTPYVRVLQPQTLPLTYDIARFASLPMIAENMTTPQPFAFSTERIEAQIGIVMPRLCNVFFPPISANDRYRQQANLDEHDRTLVTVAVNGRGTGEHLIARSLTRPYIETIALGCQQRSRWKLLKR
ncbi:hypothetical protein ASE49_12735 [Novosphingobium sp. Leaf2]|nr:hypothetical protein ASE49_12735 [Novosphingobium sp. Leaf2]